MNNMIKFFYNLEAKEILEQNEKIYFKVNNIDFILYPFFRSEQELNEIYQVCQELKKMNVPVHTFILNRENKILTNIYSKNYILLKIEDKLETEYNIMDIIEFQDRLRLTRSKNALYQNKWNELWSKKIDYFEYQIHELGKEKKVILNSFTYYIGLAENAISYTNNTIKKYSLPLNAVTLAHKRIKFPNFMQDFMNPILFLFDLKVRDIAEYIKSAFFQNENDAWVELKAFLNSKKMTIYEYQMFYARLLYPSYYFDEYERIMNQEAEEDILMPYIKKAPNYESFLKKVYFEILKISPIEPIDWIIANDKL